MIPMSSSYGWIIAAYLFMPAQSIWADDSNKFIHYACETLKGRITIRYQNSDYDKGIANINSHMSHSWNLWELVKIDVRNQVVTDLHSIKKTCMLNEQTYSIFFLPVPGNSNLLGRCGAFITAAVTITKNGTVIEDHQFEMDCQDIHTPIITGLVIEAEGKAPHIETTSWHDFYH